MSSRDGGSLELLGFSATLTDINYNWLTNPGRALSKSYAAGEFIWYMSGEDSVERIQAYSLKYRDFAEEDGAAWGAYGKRMQRTAHGNQLEYALRCLSKHGNTRQCVISLWWPGDLWRAEALDKKDLPCTLSLQFIRRGHQLHLITTMRSNDLWLGFPYDVFCFTTLQKLMANELGLEYGMYRHQVGSMHIYDRNIADAVKCLDWDGKPVRMDPLYARESLSEFQEVCSLEWQLRNTYETFMLSHDMIALKPFFVDLLRACNQKVNGVDPIFTGGWSRC